MNNGGKMAIEHITFSNIWLALGWIRQYNGKNSYAYVLKSNKDGAVVSVCHC